jgi:hypothetical protein
MIDKIRIGVMCDWEKKTGKNALELFNKPNKSFTDNRDLVYLFMSNDNPAITIETIDKMTMAEFNTAQAALIASDSGSAS